MPQRSWSLRRLIGGIYFFIMVAILGTLALYFSYRTTDEYMATMIRTRGGQASLAADLLAPLVREFELERSRLFVQAGIHEDAAKRALDTIIARPDLVRALSTDMLIPWVKTRDGETLRALVEKARHLGELHRMITTTLRGIYKCTVPARRVTVLKLDGNIVAETPPFSSEPTGTDFPPEVLQALDIRGTGMGVQTRYNHRTAEETLYIAVPLLETSEQPAGHAKSGVQSDEVSGSAKHNACSGVIVLAAPTSEVRTAITNIRIAIALAFLASVVLLFFVNAGVSKTISSPLATLSEAVGRFADGHLREQVHVTGAAEIVSLGYSFNQMAEQLRRTITRLAEERAQAQAILASMMDGVLMTDMHGIILLMNHSAETMFGRPEAELFGLSVAEANFPDELPALLQKTIDSGFPLMHEITFSHPEERNVEVHMAPVDLEGRQLGVVIGLYDITPQRKLEIMRRDFVANVSHELRTPVASIRAMAETLFAAKADDPQMLTEFLETIIGESERLSALLDDLLQLSRIESGRHLLTPEELDLSALIRHITERVIAPVAAKRQRVELDIPDHLLAVVDRDAFVQIMVNLLDNAQKYSPAGSVISVQAARDEEVVKEAMIWIRVADTGYGIPPEDLERIFERFYRVDKARSRAQGGTGLGLAIVQHLVELHGGRIAVKSEVGVGSTFTIMLPQDTAKAPQEAGELPAAPSALKATSDD